MAEHILWRMTRQDIDDPKTEEFTSEKAAIDAAAAIVGNRSVARALHDEIILLGPGDGTTSVLIHAYTREFAVRFGMIKE